MTQSRIYAIFINKFKRISSFNCKSKNSIYTHQKKFGFMVGGTAVIGHAGSIEFMHISTAYNFSGGNTSFQV
jgi:hypothetical protein